MISTTFSIGLPICSIRLHTWKYFLVHLAMFKFSSQFKKQFLLTSGSLSDQQCLRIMKLYYTRFFNLDDILNSWWCLNIDSKGISAVTVRQLTHAYLNWMKMLHVTFNAKSSNGTCIHWNGTTSAVATKKNMQMHRLHRVCFLYHFVHCSMDALDRSTSDMNCIRKNRFISTEHNK